MSLFDIQQKHNTLANMEQKTFREQLSFKEEFFCLFIEE